MSPDTKEVPWAAVAYVKSSRRRRQVFEEIAKQPQMATEIADTLGISRQTVSVFIGHLKGDVELGDAEYHIVECLTPERVNYRIYGLSELGEQVSEQINIT